MDEKGLANLSPIAMDVRNNKPVQGEFRLKHKDGHLVDIHFSNVPTVLNGRIVRSGILQDITRQKQAEMEILRSHDELEKRVEERTVELVNSQAQLRQLTDQLVTSLEEERRRISRELHDEAGQALISLKYGLASIQGDIPEGNLAARQRLAASIDIIDQVMLQIRTLSHSLRPPVLEIIGIDLSLKDYCEEFAKRTGLSIRYHGQDIPNLPDQIGISLYRFVQEGVYQCLKTCPGDQSGDPSSIYQEEDCFDGFR